MTRKKFGAPVQVIDELTVLEPTTQVPKSVSIETAAAIAGRTLRFWVNDISPGEARVVLTNGKSGDQPGIYYNLASTDIVMVTQVFVELTTVSDTCDFEVGYTDDVNGGGIFRPITCERHIRTGAVVSGFISSPIEFNPPLPVRYSDGARSITMRVLCNDASAQITPSWHGYVIKL